MKGHRFDPYEKDREQAAKERAEWFKQNKSNGFDRCPRIKRQLAGAKTRKPRPVTLAGKGRDT